MLKIIKDFDIETNDESIYLQSITHSSYANENKNKGTYERLEFLGDAVIDLLVADFLFGKGNLDESQMSSTRIMAVREETLARCSKMVKLDSHILVGNKTTLTDKVLADVFESFVGALYHDKQDQVLMNLMNKTIFHIIDSNDFEDVADYKTQLQEIVQATSKKELKYTAHQDEDGLWVASVYFDKVKMGTGKGGTKKRAEQIAAKNCIQKNNEMYLKNHK